MLLMKDIINDQNKLIRTISKEVSLPLSKEDHDLLMEMHEFLVASQDEELSEKYNLRPAVGIAAIQLGIPKRMCAIHVLDYDENGEPTKSTDYALVNPKIVSYTQKQSYLKTGEACLSVDEDVKGYVPRHAKVTIEGYDALTDQNVSIVARGFLAICLQHELDHFDGVLYYDHINKDYPLVPIENAMVIE
ncbi:MULTISPECIES: peptide deformylase [Coprobacillaceae]|uniref:peptide deformylase n=1 Tax=Coprobacillaceae TaxID=2810280 RepID=UPI000E483252|nr:MULTISPECIES: peptide deformylase [Coprobacillaceae]RHM62157.1 peptide deformylase [Coprobacillus sp. AF33-1AC]RHS96034.1 peptide deformylase [Erysipelatoclostridium sp. AM42-17]